jgi:hypothetical protein
VKRFIVAWGIIVNAPEERDPDRAGTGWSQADKRLFLITFLGGLGANVGVVLVVAAGIAFNRFEKSHWNFSSYLIAIILGAVGGLITYFVVKITNLNPKNPWLWGFGVTFATYLLLILIAYAAGISK